VSAHERRDCFAHEHWSVEVDGHDALPQVEVEFVPGGTLEDRGVIDEDVDSSELVCDPITCDRDD
jgi:hypothetical protein